MCGVDITPHSLTCVDEDCDDDFTVLSYVNSYAVHEWSEWYIQQVRYQYQKTD